MSHEGSLSAYTSKTPVTVSHKWLHSSLSPAHPPSGGLTRPQTPCPVSGTDLFKFIQLLAALLKASDPGAVMASKSTS